MQHWHRHISLVVLFALLCNLLPAAAPTRAQEARTVASVLPADLFPEQASIAPSTRPTLRSPLLHQPMPADAPLLGRRSQQQAGSLDPLDRLQSALSMTSQPSYEHSDLQADQPWQALTNQAQTRLEASVASEDAAAHNADAQPGTVADQAKSPAQPAAVNLHTTQFFPLVVSSPAQTDMTISPSQGAP